MCDQIRGFGFVNDGSVDTLTSGNANAVNPRVDLLIQGQGQLRFQGAGRGNPGAQPGGQGGTRRQLEGLDASAGDFVAADGTRRADAALRALAATSDL